MTYRHSVNKKLTAIVGILMLCAALVGTAGAKSRHHRSYHRSSVRITNVRQANRVAQANSNTFNVVAVGGAATASCSPNNGGNTATGALLAAAANVNVCFPTATGGAGTAVNTGAVTQTGTNTATATNTSGQ